MNWTRIARSFLVTPLTAVLLFALQCGVASAAPGMTKGRVQYPGGGALDDNEQLGYSVDIQNGIILVGAPTVDVSSLRDVGRAYLADLATGAVLTTLTNPTPEQFGNFGQDVLWMGDSFAVSAERANDSGIDDTGAVFLYSTASRLLTATIPNPTPTQRDNFGYALAETPGGLLAVTAPQLDGTFAAGGRAHIFNPSTNALVRTISNPSPAAQDSFGRSVAAYSGGVLIGAPGEDASKTNAGMAYLFDPVTGSALHTFTSPDLDATDSFGISLAANERYIAIGSLGVGPPGLGKVYVYDAPTRQLLHQIVAPTPEAGSMFGFSLAMDDDRLVVGAFRDVRNGARAGSAFQFSLATGNLLLKINDPSVAAGDEDYFGYDVALAGDRVVVGAPNERPFTTTPGTAWIIEGVIPEPTTATLAAGAALAFAGMTRKRKNAV
jgi:hypothetical protein